MFFFNIGLKQVNAGYNEQDCGCGIFVYTGVDKTCCTGLFIELIMLSDLRVDAHGVS
jgi:hypothetical protein